MVLLQLKMLLNKLTITFVVGYATHINISTHQKGKTHGINTANVSEFNNFCKMKFIKAKSFVLFPYNLSVSYK